MDEKRTARPRGTDSAKVISVVETRAIAGRGTEGDPVREVIQYWSLEGELLAVSDPYEKNTAPAVEEQGRQEPRFVPEDSFGKHVGLSQKCCCRCNPTDPY